MTEATILEILKHYGLADAKICSIKKGYRNTSVHAICGVGTALCPLDGGAVTEHLEYESLAQAARDCTSNCSEPVSHTSLGHSATKSGQKPEQTGQYNLIIYKREPGMIEVIQTVNAVGLYLHERGFPARYPLDSRTVKVYAKDPAQYAGLYHYLPGTTIVWEAYTRKHLVSLGKTMSDLHSILESYAPAHPMPQTHTVVASYLNKAQNYLSGSGVQSALEAKLGLKVDTSVLTTSLAAVELLGTSQRKQVLHMDFVRGNVLFDDSCEISGVLDFEKASYGNPLFDIARTLAFLYVDCLYKEPSDVVKSFLRSGYAKRGHAKLPAVTDKAGNDRTHELIEKLICAFLIYDFYKFLRHNPYEFLQQNKHFTRTRDQLIKRGFMVNCSKELGG